MENKIETTKLFSSVTRIKPNIYERFPRDRERWQYPCVRLGNKSIIFVNSLLKKFGKYYSVEELCHLSHIYFPVTRQEKDKVFLNPNSLRNFRFVYNDEDYYLIGTKNLKQDNFYVRVLEQLAYTGTDSFEAREAVVAQSIFYDDAPVEVIKGHLKRGELILIELPDLKTGKIEKYYKYQPNLKYLRQN